ncbi:MAG: DUF2017 domain-containing protein [Actinomycetota bacterium]|nr:DUF2017 domain-containing protein [Actinomycetota bacterium]
MPELERHGDRLHLQLDQQETGILRELLKELRMLLEADIPADDEVLQRLFPRAHQDDAEEEAYRELMGNDLRTVKLEALHVVEEGVGAKGAADLTLSQDEVESWLRLLNDIRLAIGTRLEVDDEKMGRAYDPADPEAPALAVLHWLGWLQGSMLEEMST